MQLLDVNVLVYAFRKDAPDHYRFARWMQELVNGHRAFGVPDIVFSGFMRIVTHPRIFAIPSLIDEAINFAQCIRESPAFVPIAPGPRHWDIFVELCHTTGVRGNLAPDAYLAALAVELGGEWITTDYDYARFPGLHWRHPLK